MWKDYINRVKSGKRLAGDLEKMAVDRCLALMSKPEYYFDEDEANRILSILSILKHTKGEYYGKPFNILPWQGFFFSYIFGLKRKDNNKRLTRRVLLCMSKKGGKSEVGGALGVLMTYFDGENGAENYSAANGYDQAKFSWDAAKKMCKQLAKDSPSFANTFKCYDSITTRSILDTASDSFFKPIAANNTTLDGVNPHLGLIDEYHEAKDSLIPDNLESGMVAREQPLLCMITTRGFNINGPLAQLEKVYIDILKGLKEDDSVFPLIFSLDEGDEWTDKNVWPKSNPGIGTAPSWDGLNSEFDKAITQGSEKEISFKTKNLNIWARQSKAWIAHKVWKKNNKKFELENLYGRICFGGIDLAISRDLTAYGLLFPPDEEGGDFIFYAKYYCPEENARERARKDSVPYLDWVREGRLIMTPGNVTDYRYIMEDIIEDCKNYNVVSIGYDPFNATQPATILTEEGVPMAEFRQRFSNFNAPIGTIERELMRGGLNFNNCPVLLWMGGNVKIKMNAQGDRMFDKGKSKEKIDGMVALAMCFGEWLDKRDQFIEQDYSVEWF